MPTPGDPVPGTLRSGTKEYMLISIGDHLESVTNLGPLNPIFNVYDPEDTPKQTNVPASVDSNMIAKCLIDTTLGGNWPSNKYRLYLHLTAGDEAPILGPVIFRVEEL